MPRSDPSLQFSHLGDLFLEGRLTLADASLIAGGFQGLQLSHAGTPFPAQAHVAVRPGAWHVFTAGPSGGAPELLFLAHHEELEVPHEAPEADLVGRIMLPTKRVVVAHPDLGGDPAICQALSAVDPAELPGMVLHLGVLANVDGGPILSISSTTGAPHTSLVVPLAGP
jgi:hypothetical protein